MKIRLYLNFKDSSLLNALELKSREFSDGELGCQPLVRLDILKKHGRKDGLEVVSVEGECLLTKEILEGQKHENEWETGGQIHGINTSASWRALGPAVCERRIHS